MIHGLGRVWAALGVWGLHIVWFPVASLAQGFEVPEDARERDVAGCYVVVAEEVTSLFGVDPELGPDTIELSLDAGHYGGVSTMRVPFDPETRSFRRDLAYSVPWRQSGWLLRVRPDPFGSVHSFAHWAMPSDSALVIRGDGRGFSYLIEAEPQRAGWLGTLRLHPEWLSPDYARDPYERWEEMENRGRVDLRPVECPTLQRFREMERDFHARPTDASREP